MLTYQIILDIFGILSDKSSASSFFSQYYLQLYAQFENFMRRLCPDTQKIYNIILAFFIQTSSLTVHSEWNGGDISGEDPTDIRRISSRGTYKIRPLQCISASLAGFYIERKISKFVIFYEKSKDRFC